MSATEPVTALVRLTDNAQTCFENVCDVADEVTQELEGFQIRSKTDEVHLNELLSRVKVAAGDIEHARRGQVDPLNAQVKAINDLWRRPKAALEALEATCKRTLTIWLQAERERIAREQAEARRLQEEAARKAAEAERARLDALAKAEATKNSRTREKALAAAELANTAVAAASQALVQARIDEPMDAPRGVSTDSATTGLVAKWTFQVTDKTLVPAAFLVVDEKAIRAAVAAGARDIPGVTIYQEETLSTRIRKS